jgi:lipopolysaccharide biosynthesis regulator YciM
MELDLPWLLLGLPLAFALGWLASRFDLRQLGRDSREGPRAYFKGLNLLLNEQHDKAIDAFIEAVQHDADTAELQFGLGNLFRGRGEFERAVRVHQHLLGRGDLKEAERQRAQHALALDFLKAGLFDRAEAAFGALLDTPFDEEARLALLGLHERARDWAAASAVATELERRGHGSFATRIAHHACELALEADARGDGTAAEAALQRARAVAPQAPRPLLLAAERLVRTGRPAAAVPAYAELLRHEPAVAPLAAAGLARAAKLCGQEAAAAELLDRASADEPGVDLLQARLELADTDEARRRLLLEHLQRRPGLVAAARVLELPPERLDAQTAVRVHDVVAAAAQPLQRFRCAACGFEPQHYFWQCPGCQGWDTLPPRRVEAL